MEENEGENFQNVVLGTAFLYNIPKVQERKLKIYHYEQIEGFDIFMAFFF